MNDGHDWEKLADRKVKGGPFTTRNAAVQAALNSACCDLSEGEEEDFCSDKVGSVDYDGGEHSGCYGSVVQHKFKGTAAPGQKAEMWSNNCGLDDMFQGPFRSRTEAVTALFQSLPDEADT